MLYQIIKMIIVCLTFRSYFFKPNNDNEEDAIRFLEDYNRDLENYTNIAVLADWEYNTNLTEENAQRAVSVFFCI